MKKLIIFSCWIGVITYCVLTIIVGPSGYIAQKNAEKQISAMSQNLKELKKLNETYRLELYALETETSSVILESRSMGYVKSNEVMIQTNSIPQSDYKKSPGQWLSFSTKYPVSDQSIKIITFILAMLIFFITMLIKLFVRGIKEKSVKQGLKFSEKF